MNSHIIISANYQVVVKECQECCGRSQARAGMLERSAPAVLAISRAVYVIRWPAALYVLPRGGLCYGQNSFASSHAN